MNSHFFKLKTFLVSISHFIFWKTASATDLSIPFITASFSKHRLAVNLLQKGGTVALRQLCCLCFKARAEQMANNYHQDICRKSCMGVECPSLTLPSAAACSNPTQRSVEFTVYIYAGCKGRQPSGGSSGQWLVVLLARTKLTTSFDWVELIQFCSTSAWGWFKMPRESRYLEEGLFLVVAFSDLVSHALAAPDCYRKEPPCPSLMETVFQLLRCVTVWAVEKYWDFSEYLKSLICVSSFGDHWRGNLPFS